MNIYDRIQKDHDKHRSWLNELADTSGDSLVRQKVWQKFYCDVKAHAAAEEEAFYAPLMETVAGQSESRHSVAEHKDLDDIMEDLNSLEMSSPGWLTRFKTLKHDYLHHITEEEEDIFQTAKDVLGGDRDGTMAQKFESRKTRERQLVDEKSEDALSH